MKRSRIQRKTRMKARNSKRKAKLYAKNFGEHADWVRTLACLVNDAECRGLVEPHHYPTVGSGGTAKNITPLCNFHHIAQFHRMGPKTFQERYGLDLKAIAACLWKINGGTDVDTSG